MFKKAHVIFRGEVQGVGFRFTARSIARELGVVGWVKNAASGDVEAEVQADEPVVLEYLDRLKREFVRHIQGVDVSWVETDVPAGTNAAGFEIRL
jgi:acylphosphatase